MAKNEQLDEELELGKVHTTMVNMTVYDEQESSYIIDLRRDGKNIIVTYADGHEEVMDNYSLHNMNFYRYKIQRQFFEYYDEYMDQMALESFKVCCKKFGSIGVGLLSLFLLYNFDIHIIIKIIISLGIIALNIFYYFVKHYDLLVISQELGRVEALETYFNNSRDFMIHNHDAKEDDFVLGVEDVWKNDLSKDEVMEILGEVKESNGRVLKYDVSKYKESKKDNVL